MYEFNPADHPFVTFDIETTGFKAVDSIVSVVLKTGPALDETAHVIAKGDANTLAQDGRLSVPSATVCTTSVDSEEELLAEMRSTVEKIQEMTADSELGDPVFVAYHGETYRGGFDLGALRTRSNELDAPFPLWGMLYTDIAEVFERQRFNTTRPSAEGLNKSPLQSYAEYIGVDSSGYVSDIKDRVNDADADDETLIEWAEAENDGEVPTKEVTDLGGVYDILIGEDLAVPDPIESSEVPEAVENGNIGDVVCHNLADVLQTEKLLEMVLSTGIAIKEVKPKQLASKRS